MIVEISSSFSAAHFYQNPQFSDAKNREHFGKCYSQYGHGHDYQLFVTFELHSQENAEEQVHALKNTLHQLTEELDHQHLNMMIPYFQSHIPTTENIVTYCLQKLIEKKLSQKIKKVVLYERDDLWTELINP